MLVEVPFLRACTSCCYLVDLIVPTASHLLVQLGGGGAASSPAGPGQSSGGVQGALPLELQKSGISRYKIQPKTHFRGSISFYKMNLKGKIIHLMFQTNTRLYKYSRVEVENSKAYFAFVHQYSSAIFKSVWMQKPITKSFDLRYWGWFPRFSG